MTAFAPLFRAGACAALLLPVSALPTMSAPADLARVQSYLGNWQGQGVVIGAEVQQMPCQLEFRPGNRDRVVFNGLCILGGLPVPIAGTLVYSEASQQYEAAMSSSGYTVAAVGQERGRNLIFNLRERETDDGGEEFSVTARLQLTEDQIDVEFYIVHVETGDNLRGEVPLTR
jgi:hypothetical protein